jgi:hypothetical protein
MACYNLNVHRLAHRKGWQISFTSRWTFSWGPAWDWKGSTYVEAQHGAAKGQPKVNGGDMTGVCWAPRAAHLDRRLHCTSLPQLGAHVACQNQPARWTFSWGPAWEGSMYMEAQHRAAIGQPKVNGGHVTGACWTPGAVQRDRRLHRMSLLFRIARAERSQCRHCLALGSWGYGKLGRVG